MSHYLNHHDETYLVLGREKTQITTEIRGRL